jgi:predicted nucleic-acid-binding Zn-ribbon protein
MKKIWNYFFGKRKDGWCRWWQHEYGESVKEKWMSNTGTYIDGKPIQRKKYWYKSTCKKCGWYTTTDVYTDWS